MCRVTGWYLIMVVCSLELILWLPSGDLQSSDGTGSQGSEAFLRAKILQLEDLSLPSIYSVFFLSLWKKRALK